MLQWLKSSWSIVYLREDKIDHAFYTQEAKQKKYPAPHRSSICSALKDPMPQMQRKSWPLRLAPLGLRPMVIYLYGIRLNCMYLCMYVCMYVCMYACMHPCLYLEAILLCSFWWFELMILGEFKKYPLTVFYNNFLFLSYFYHGFECNDSDSWFTWSSNLRQNINTFNVLLR